jgi:hypothetical protein
VFAGPLRTVEELLLRHRAATVFQSLWRGRMGRRAVDTAMSFALFRRFADRCGRTAVFSTWLSFLPVSWCLSPAVLGAFLPIGIQFTRKLQCLIFNAWFSAARS